MRTIEPTLAVVIVTRLSRSPICRWLMRCRGLPSAEVSRAAIRSTGTGSGAVMLVALTVGCAGTGQEPVDTAKDLGVPWSDIVEEYGEPDYRVALGTAEIVGYRTRMDYVRTHERCSAVFVVRDGVVAESHRTGRRCGGRAGSLGRLTRLLEGASLADAIALFGTPDSAETDDTGGVTLEYTYRYPWSYDSAAAGQPTADAGFRIKTSGTKTCRTTIRFVDGEVSEVEKEWDLGCRTLPL